MSEKTFKIVGGDISDGYHTFDELYQHRCLLFLLWLVEEQAGGGDRNVYWVADHILGWDLVVTNLPRGQIGYRVPIKYRSILRKHFVQSDQIWGGHTSQEVAQRILERLLDLSMDY